MELNSNRTIIGYPQVTLAYTNDHIECVRCALNPANILETIYPYYAYSVHRILTHMRSHYEQGDTVPAHLEKELFEKESEIFPEGGTNKGTFIVPAQFKTDFLTTHGPTE